MNLSQHHAKLVIHDADKMTKTQRKGLATWLRAHAECIENYKESYAPRFTGRYMKT